MTADLDLSPEAVERLASQFDRCASIVDSVELPGAKIPFINTAATLRALSAKNARLRAERDAAWQAGAEATVVENERLRQEIDRLRNDGDSRIESKVIE